MTGPRPWRALGLAVALGVGPRAGVDAPAWLGSPTHLAAGVDLYQSADRSLVAAAGPVALAAVRLDPARVRLSSVLSRTGEVDAADTLDHIAAAHGALVAVNGGLFNAGNHEPVGILKVAGELVSDLATPEGIVAIRAPAHGKTTIRFDLASVSDTVTFAVGRETHTVPVDGVDTTRARGKLMLYTPMYHADTDTAPTGTEWRLEGSPLEVTEKRTRQPHVRIPAAGLVLSYGGTDLPPALAGLTVGVRVTVHTTWTTRFGLSAGDLEAADAVVGGAGLLRVNGQAPADWPATDSLGGTLFVRARHPRTLIGADGRGFIWLVAVDGGDASRSIGMTFEDLDRLCDRLGLKNALNLDGGSSTTLVAGGKIVNHPVGGPAPVNNAILVTAR